MKSRVPRCECPKRRPDDESRSISIRRYRIHQIFQRDHFTNCPKLGHELEVGIRTILRDIEAMRRLDYPIDYDPRKRAYYYTERVFNLPSIQIRQGDLLALSMASQSLRYTSWPAIHRRLSKICRLFLTGTRVHDPAIHMDQVESHFSFHRVGVGLVDSTIFERLSEAVSHSEEVEFDYRKPADCHSKHHRVRPYFISERDNLFYLVASEDGCDVPKTFCIPRIHGSVRMTGKRFERSDKLSLSKFFRHSFRSFSGESPRHVKLKFSQRSAPYIKERLWHSSQRTTDLPEGGLLFEMDISDPRDIHSWVLRWGADVEVIEPADLRMEIASSIGDMGEVYK